MTLARHGSAPPSTRITRAKEAEERDSTTRKAQAARTVADHATSVRDCGELLAMLGLDAGVRAPRRTADMR